MISENDKKALKRSTSKVNRLSIVFGLPVVSLLGIIIGVVNLIISSRFASMVGLSINDLFSLWRAGLEPGADYSGLNIMALERLQSGLTMIVLSAFLLVLVPFLWKRFKRSERILKALEDGNSSTDIPDDESDELKEKLKSLGYLG